MLQEADYTLLLDTHCLELHVCLLLVYKEAMRATEVIAPLTKSKGYNYIQ